LTKSLMADAFAHHLWATRQLIDICLTLDPEQLAHEVKGTYGSILDTIRHIVGADSFYVFTFVGKWPTSKDPAQMDLVELQEANERLRDEWTRLLDSNLDPDEVVKEVDSDGFKRDAPVGIRLAQALHHGNEHRSQICTALTSLGLEAADISVWRFGLLTGRSVEVLPASP